MDGERLFEELVEMVSRALSRDSKWIEEYEKATGGAGNAPREPELRGKREK